MIRSSARWCSATCTSATSSIAERLIFACEAEPAILEVGGARVLITHGDHNDVFNKFDHEAIAAGKAFVYPPGSKLVKRVINRVMRDFGLLWVNYLKPDFEGGVLCGLAVEPRCLKVALEEGSLGTLRQILKNLGPPKLPRPGFLGPADETIEEEDEEPAAAGEAPPTPESEISVRARLAEANLERAEIKALFKYGLRDQEGDVSEDPVLERARVKLGHAGAQLIGGIHRQKTGGKSEAYFALSPAAEEWREARRLAREHGVQAVVLGHTHAARFREAEGVIYANTGTWTWLMEFPDPAASDEVWGAFLEELRDNRALAPDRQAMARPIRRLTAAVIEPHAASGAVLSLMEYDKSDFRVLSIAHVTFP